ncbi:MAG TPA: B12-binding domain-containing radical SAM protein [Thermoplasmata archaeon]|nr:B12-binding domain-containing radical SAM protein [Thermoplasmata archaeon]
MQYLENEFRKRGVFVVLGGWHPSALPEEAKQHADSVVIGEAEETWPQLLKDLENKKTKPFYIPTRPVDPKLIPFPFNVYPDGPILGVQATRGCPFGCEFCAITNMRFRNVFRMRAVEDVVEEIKTLPGKTFNFHDNSLTINPTYTKQLLREMKGLDKKFYAFGNINVLGSDEELLKLASEAGCVGWLIGFESMSQESLDIVGKKTNVVQTYLDSVSKIHDYGMIILGSFVFGFDGDKKEVFDLTDDFVRKSEIDVPDAMILTPYPGTPLYDKLEREGRILTKNWSKYNFEHVVFKPKHMTPDELLENTKGLYRKWHGTPHFMKRVIKSFWLGGRAALETTMQNLYMKLLRYQE